DLADADIVGADRGMADIVHHALDERVTVGFDVVEDRLQLRIDSLHCTPPSRRVSRMAPVSCTLPDQPGGTRVVVSSCERITGPSKAAPAPSDARSISGVFVRPPAKCTGTWS